MALTLAALPRYFFVIVMSMWPATVRRKSWLFPPTAQCVIAVWRSPWKVSGIMWAVAVERGARELRAFEIKLHEVRRAVASLSRRHVEEGSLLRLPVLDASKPLALRDLGEDLVENFCQSIHADEHIFRHRIVGGEVPDEQHASRILSKSRTLSQLIASSMWKRRRARSGNDSASIMSARRFSQAP